ncbi:serine/threonine protein kinase [Basidiobolus ranarum]|uniref:non-specific serine/threonine protein kinase n=1 Tax=Basidiobolus ranarum TaxID=34480 RepID=A0ABR2WU03_9FUNG
MIPSISPSKTSLEHDNDMTLYNLMPSLEKYTKSSPHSFLVNTMDTKLPKSCLLANCIKTRPHIAKRLLLLIKAAFSKQKNNSCDLLSSLVKQKSGSIEKCYGTFIDARRSGSGGMVRITCNNEKKYAVKTFRECQKDEPRHKYLQWINNEITIALKLKHPYIVQTYEVLKEDGKIHSVMEYCPYDLYHLVEEGKVTQELAAKYFVQLVHAINYIHSCGIAHRDIKLENICVDEDGSMKLIDYGCAFVFRASPQHESRAASTMCGSLAYIAPELHTCDSYDPCKSDIWSIAVVYLTMILRSFPWSTAMHFDHGYKMFLKYRNNSHYFNRIPESAIPVIRKMLDPNPDTRASIQDVLSDPWVKSIALDFNTIL